MGDVPSRKLWRRSLVVACLILFSNEVFVTPIEAASNQLPAPQLAYTTQQGLDVKNNRIDQLIHTFGFTCEHIARYPKACRIELELIAFLAAMPANRATIAIELNALGASCESTTDYLNCIYSRSVLNTGWIAGNPIPIAVSDELFHINLKILGQNGALRFEAKFNRTSRIRAPGIISVTVEMANLDSCPKEGTSIALFTRQAFDEGRESEGREYGQLVGELSGIARARDTEENIVEKSITAITNFVKKMRAINHDVAVGEIVVHRESELNYLIRLNLSPIRRATLELQLSVIREVKKVICRR